MNQQRKYKVLDEAGELVFPKETKEIDKLLSEIAAINAGVGKGSSDSERKSAWRKIWNRELKIKEIDYMFYKQIHPTDDDIA